ncbi:MAG: amino acid-binding protein [Clostridia bacterium]|nr:amino acid-binding protein [Clostridia bacterium]MBO7689755.1 amino acid-binding protein [Clostridia bacterium]
MMKQVSVYAANKKGAMNRITTALREANVNLLALVTNDSAEFGTIRMIVDKPEEALYALREAGYISQLTDVIGVEIFDEVGGLDKLLADITFMNVSVDYLYICYNRDNNTVIAVLHTETDIEDILAHKGWTISNI